MIRRLRRRHRLAWAVLFPVLAVLLASALLSRPTPPLVDSLPEAREMEVPATGGPPAALHSTVDSLPAVPEARQAEVGAGVSPVQDEIPASGAEEPAERPAEDPVEPRAEQPAEQP